MSKSALRPVIHVSYSTILLVQGILILWLLENVHGKLERFNPASEHLPSCQSTCASGGILSVSMLRMDSCGKKSTIARNLHRDFQLNDLQLLVLSRMSMSWM